MNTEHLYMYKEQEELDNSSGLASFAMDEEERDEDYYQESEGEEIQEPERFPEEYCTIEEWENEHERDTENEGKTPADVSAADRAVQAGAQAYIAQKKAQFPPMSDKEFLKQIAAFMTRKEIASQSDLPPPIMPKHLATEYARRKVAKEKEKKH